MIIKPEDKIAIYSAVIGSCDKEIIKSTYKNDNDDMFLFTNNHNILSHDRVIHYVEKLINDDVRASKFIKIMPHLYLQQYKYSLYIDGHISIIDNIRDMINNHISTTNFTGIVLLEHPYRTCAYNEAKECIKLKKDYKEIIEKQITKYEHELFPKNIGLIRGGVIFREHNNPNVIKIMETWLSEVLNGSRRDQISFNYAVWKNNARYNQLSKVLYTKYFKQHKCHNSHI